MTKIDLRTPNLMEVKPGTIVITSKGFEFERVNSTEETWLDLTTGLMWFDREPEMYNYDQAMDKFNKPERRLPTIEEFTEAEGHGFREVLPNMKVYFFWSASLYSYNPAVSARYFDGSDGDDYGVGVRNYDVSVRCVEGDEGCNEINERGNMYQKLNLYRLHEIGRIYALTQSEFEKHPLRELLKQIIMSNATLSAWVNENVKEEPHETIEHPWSF